MLRRTVALFASHCRASVATSNADYTCGEGGIEDMVAFIVMAPLGQFMLGRLSHDILCQISAFIFDVNIHHNLARLRRCCSWRRFIDGARFLEERDTRVISNEILFTLMDYLPSISRSMNRGMNPNCIDPNYTRKPLSLEQSWLLSLLPGVLGDDVLASILHLFGTCVRPHSPPYLTSHHPPSPRGEPWYFFWDAADGCLRRGVCAQKLPDAGADAAGWAKRRYVDDHRGVITEDVAYVNA